MCKPIFAFSPFGLEHVLFGPSLSNFLHTDNSYKLGYAIGFQGEKPLNKYSFFSWSIIYNTKGAILKDKFIHPINSVGKQKGSNYIADIHVSVSFLEFPIYLNYSLYTKNSIRFSIFSGPQISFALKDFTKLKNKRASPVDDWSLLYSYSDVYDYETNSVYKYLDKGVKLGYNWGVLCQYGAFSLHLRYTYLKQKFESSNRFRSLDKKIYSFNFLLGYHF